jgi:hypothetical protein
LRRIGVLRGFVVLRAFAAALRDDARFRTAFAFLALAALRGFLGAPSMRKSSGLDPRLSAAVSQRGCRPRPVRDYLGCSTSEERGRASRGDQSFENRWPLRASSASPPDRCVCRRSSPSRRSRPFRGGSPNDRSSSISTAWGAAPQQIPRQRHIIEASPPGARSIARLVPRRGQKTSSLGVSASSPALIVGDHRVPAADSSGRRRALPRRVRPDPP